ncbi:MAG: TadE/TadG family type IV pilus assembly protein [Pseudomonadota bacterium]
MGGAIRRSVARFIRDAGGAVTVEFVVTLPILFAVLAFASQYGRAMQVRNAMDVAVRDAARYVARAPTVSGVIPNEFTAKATDLVTARIISSGDAVTAVNKVNITTTTTDIVVDVEVLVEFPFLSAIGTSDEVDKELTSITMVASESWPRTE